MDKHLNKLIVEYVGISFSVIRVKRNGKWKRAIIVDNNLHIISGQNIVEIKEKIVNELKMVFPIPENNEKELYKIINF